MAFECVSLQREATFNIENIRRVPLWGYLPEAAHVKKSGSAKLPPNGDPMILRLIRFCFAEATLHEKRRDLDSRFAVKPSYRTVSATVIDGHSLKPGRRRTRSPERLS